MNHYTTLEQSKKLIKAGLDPKTNGYIFGVFSMVLWLLENGYIKKGENQ